MGVPGIFQHLGNKHQGKTLAIVVGGGPAPGINGVIRAVTIEALKNGLRVLGIREGYKWLAQGETDYVEELTMDVVSRIHYQGGSILQTSRVNPTKSKEAMDNVMRALTELNVDFLVSIGGDDTAYTASQIDIIAGDRIEVAHVPKTIDNDLPLPQETKTFGFETARHIGTDIVGNIMEDARTAQRWYFIVAMGRKAGYLALGIGTSAGTTLSMIPEDFKERPAKFQRYVDILESSIIKRMATGRPFGVAIIAEGLSEITDPEDLAHLKNVERDAHGNIRFSEIPLGALLKNEVRNNLKSRGVEMTIVDKNIGYELRCAKPIPSDMVYVQELGYYAVRFLLNGGTGALINITSNSLEPIPFTKLLDPSTGKTKIRMVDPSSDNYKVARDYMVLLRKEDIEDKKILALLAQTANMTEKEFVERFGYLVED